MSAILDTLSVWRYPIALFAVFWVLCGCVLFIVDREIQCDRLPEDEYFQWRKKRKNKSQDQE